MPYICERHLDAEGGIIMKKWIAPEVQELSINETANGTAFYNEDSGEGNYIDLGTCNNAYWNGNGMSIEDAQKNNPYWGGSWGSNGGWGS